LPSLQLDSILSPVLSAAVPALFLTLSSPLLSPTFLFNPSLSFLFSSLRFVLCPPPFLYLIRAFRAVSSCRYSRGKLRYHNGINAPYSFSDGWNVREC